MSIAGISSNPLLALTSASRTGGSAAASAFLPTSNNAAKSAGAVTILPSASPVQLSPDMLIALQGAPNEPKITPASLAQLSPEDLFLAEAQKSPMERMRDQVMKALGLSEDALAQMSPEERRAAEDRIRDMIEAKIREAMNAGKDPTASNGAMLETLI